MKKKILLKCILFLVVIASFLKKIFSFKKPSNDKDWSLDQKVLPDITFGVDGLITIRNIRYCKYTSELKYVCSYYDKTFNINNVTNLSYIVEHFNALGGTSIFGAAHTFVSFGLDDGSYVAVSVEIRKKGKEAFSAFLGFFNRNELMYVISDERDIVKLRSNYRDSKVYVHPVKVPINKIQELFVDMLKRAKKLQEKPEFFNTALSTCTTNIVDHVNKIAKDLIPEDYRIWVPENADELAYELGLLGKDFSFAKLRKRHFINKRAKKHANSLDFSRKIREVVG